MQRPADVGWNTGYGWRWKFAAEEFPAWAFLLQSAGVEGGGSRRWLALLRKASGWLSVRAGAGVRNLRIGILTIETQTA